jgi:hypothetical protein
VPAGLPAPTDSDEATIAVVSTSKLARKIGAVGVVRSKVDCRMIVVCGLPPLARAPSDFERALFGQCSAHEAARPGLPGGRPGGSSGRPDGAQRPGSPRLPAPDPQPQGPTAPGSSSGSGGTGGFHSGADLGLSATLLSLAPLWGSCPVTPYERRRRAVLLVLLLERPG